MDVLLVGMHLERHEVESPSRLLQCRDAVVWVHIPVCNWQAVNVLSGVFGIHADRGCGTAPSAITSPRFTSTRLRLLGSSPPRIGKRVHVHYVETAGGRNSAVFRWRFGIGWWLVVLFGLPVIALLVGLSFGGSLNTADLGPVLICWVSG
jgi:hypothetical protein